MENRFAGAYVSGEGSERWLSLIDKSLAMLHPSAELPSLPMLVNGKYRTYQEGFIWGGWWIQNSLGFCLGAAPLLSGEWRDTLGRSFDLFWDRMGDGRRYGTESGISPNNGSCLDLCGPDGCLGDAVLFGRGIAYRQGDGDFKNYDWFYEATAAGILTEAELCLFARDRERALSHLPKLRRSMEFIEKKRAENGLFLVGPCCNLLAPSWGAAYDPANDRVIPAYLTGLSVTYGAALRTVRELAAFVGDPELEELCEARYEATRSSLKQLLTPEGYLAKSMDPDGTLHGVYGAEKYGYFEGVCNVDAIAYDMVEDAVQRRIYDALSSVEGLRRYGPICTNYPHLDDTYRSYTCHTDKPDSTGFRSGDWVDGGCWCTVEGRALLSYFRLGRYEDAFRAADCYMKWAEDWRQDAPLSQWGANTDNPWAAEGNGYEKTTRPIAVMVDNFAAVTCLLRGLFACIPTRSGILVRPQIPDEIRSFTLREPFSFGGCKVNFSYCAGAEKPVLYLDGKAVSADENGYFLIPGELLDERKSLSAHFDCSGECPVPKAGTFREAGVPDLSVLPDEIRAVYDEVRDSREPFAEDVVNMIYADAMRRTLPFPEGHFRPMFPEKKAKIFELYDQTVKTMASFLK